MTQMIHTILELPSLAYHEFFAANWLAAFCMYMLCSIIGGYISKFLFVNLPYLTLSRLMSRDTFYKIGDKVLTRMLFVMWPIIALTLYTSWLVNNLRDSEFEYFIIVKAEEDYIATISPIYKGDGRDLCRVRVRRLADGALVGGERRTGQCYLSSSGAFIFSIVGYRHNIDLTRGLLKPEEPAPPHTTILPLASGQLPDEQCVDLLGEHSPQAIFPSPALEPIQALRMGDRCLIIGKDLTRQGFGVAQLSLADGAVISSWTR